MGRKVQYLKSLLELNGVTDNDRKAAGRSVGLTGDGDSGVLEDPFYWKLVEADSDDIAFKVHDLARLVSDVHRMKVFYTFLNHLYRAKRISKDDRQRCTLKAIQETNKTISKSDNKVITIQEKIVEKCQEDGVLISGFGDHNPDHTGASTEPVSFWANDLAMIEFRVGEVLPRTAAVLQATANTHNFSIDHRVVLAQAQALGRSLNELYAALEANDGSRASTAAICSILNALSFGPSIFGGISSEIAVSSLLDEIVDFGDMNHICLVVDHSGNEQLQNAVQQGIAIVEGSLKQLALKSDDKTSGENERAGSSVLATVIGHFANEVMKWTRDADDMPKKAEAISVLALVATTKIIQAGMESVDREQNVPSRQNVGGKHATIMNTRQGPLSLSGGKSSFAMTTKILETSPLASNKTTSASWLTETARDGQAPSLLQLMSRLEEAVSSLEEMETMRGGHATSIVERFTGLEESVSSKVDELKRIFEQLEHRMCKLEGLLGCTD